VKPAGSGARVPQADRSARTRGLVNLIPGMRVPVVVAVLAVLAGGFAAGLADVHFVAVPEQVVAFGGPSGVEVVGGGQPVSPGRQALSVFIEGPPPLDHLLPVPAVRV
jgi:hypothetical protein